MNRAVIIVSGIPGVGKSTISSMLARTFPRGVHLEAEALQRFIVSGGLWPDGSPSDEAFRQLRLRGRNAALLAESFFEAGFTTVIDDVVIGKRLTEFQQDLQVRPLFFVLLIPSLETVRDRNSQRLHKNVFEAWKHLHEVTLQETPKLGLWIDSSKQTPDDTLHEILDRIGREGPIP